ncbi:shufflon system plasmid conjugative transfer pilus tip adhesin PilV [Pseudoduganella chitinolytica]|uniref:Shufflon system plasmid conjugative transfer pilus tip adhesin PilV n=1 Tax=Pseudoduganella chitinolytica TaxID=34070 RepID=A0ABY8B8J0_9BURK|nr:shufflon system plasmid conjugative transfer pilus tip adhesin PilV [Pseudoduganella chitinolytica]WEF32249.1 shufflon system plasmid conjugative transfer pilus tip adhesin PilV [Pseudoduganella chitinolytica]
MKRTLARQRGMTLIEVLAALAIGAVLLVGLATLVDRSLDDMKGQQTASYQAQVVDAASRYLDAKFDVVVAGTPTAATVLPITLEQLRTAKFLPASFSDTNAYGQGTCVLVRRPDPTFYPKQFDALIVTTAGTPIEDKDLPAIAIQAGSGGGYILSTAFEQARGASWQMPTTAFRGTPCVGATPALQGNKADGGHLVSSLFYDGAAQQKADFLYRDKVPGHPEANTMGAPVRFAGVAVVQSGNPCKTAEDESDFALAMDKKTHGILTCRDGKWSSPSSWKEPVSSYGSLPPASESEEGDVRIVKGMGRAFAMTAGEWKPLAVDEDGNFEVPGKLRANEVEALAKVVSKGTIHADDHIWTNLDVHVGQDLYVERKAKINGDLAVERDAAIKGELAVKGDIRSDLAIYAKGMEAKEWMSAPAIALSTKEVALGGKCNYEAYSTYAKRMVTVYPRGIIVPDRNARLMICGTDDVFIYVK